MKKLISAILIGTFLFSCMPVITKSFLREKYGDEIGIRLYEENVKIGDTKEMVQDMYGEPTEIQIDKVERWFYRRHSPFIRTFLLKQNVITITNYYSKHFYFYFENDTLINYMK